MPPHHMTTQELKDFILGYCDDKIYTWFDCHEHDISIVFMILVFMENKAELLKDIGCIWEHMSEAGPRSCNGQPMFMSCHLMHKKDWDICKKAIIKEIKRREDIQLDLEETKDDDRDEKPGRAVPSTAEQD